MPLERQGHTDHHGAWRQQFGTLMLLDPAVRIELAQHARRNLPLAVLCNAPAVALMGLAFGPAVPWFMAAWLAGTVAHSAYVLARAWQFSRGTLDAQLARQVMQVLRGTALVIGTSWAVALMWVFPLVGPADQYLLIYAVVLMSVGAVFGYGMDARGFHAFVLPYAVAALTVLAMTPMTYHFVLTGGMAVFLASIVFFAHTFRNMFIGSVRARFENAGLVRELTAQKEIAETANLEKSRFLAAASHDLRQPLHALTLLAGSAEERNRDAALQPTITGIQQSVAAMLDLFNDLLDISRIETHEVEREHFPLQPLFERLQQEFSSFASHKRLHLRFRPTSAVIDSDPLLFERILRNLVGNALKYTERGGVLVAVRCECTWRRIEVWDTGIGIPLAEHQRIFDDFYQIDQPLRSRRDGTGLGLAIVKRLAESLSHPLTLRSRQGRGSVFILSVPAGDPQQTQGALTLASARTASALLDQARILVFDDEEAVVSALETVMGGWGVQVSSGTSLPAIEAIVEEGLPPDFIVVDYQLSPTLHGGQFIETVRHRFGQHIPALVLTGNLDAVDGHTRQLERVHVLSKPLAASKLKALLMYELRSS